MWAKKIIKSFYVGPKFWMDAILTIDRHGLEMFEGKDTKIDLINFYENQIEVTKLTTDTKGLEQLERSLQILKGIEAKKNSNIPHSI